MNYFDQLKQINEVYVYEIEMDKLVSAYSTLSTILNVHNKTQTLTSNNFEIAESLFYKLGAKILVMKYYENGYLTQDGEKLISYLAKHVQLANQKKYQKTETLCRQLLDFNMRIKDIMDQILVYMGNIRGDEGLLTDNVDEIGKVKKFLTEYLEQVEKLPDTKDIYAGKAKMFDLKTRVLKDINLELEELGVIVNQLNDKRQAEFVKNYVVSLDKKYPDYLGEYYPVYDFEGQRKPNCLFLYTPIEREVVIFIQNFAKFKKKQFVVLNMGSMRGKNAKEISLIFDYLAQKNLSCLITDVEEYRDSLNVEELFAQIIAYSKRGNYAFLWDASGNQRQYNIAFDAAKKTESLSVMDVSFVYMSVPSYSETDKLLQSLGILSVGQLESIKTSIGLMGFCGLSALVKAHSLGRDWLSVAKAFNDENLPYAIGYFASIPTQSLLLDSNWGDFSKYLLSAENNKKEFDYDNITTVNPRVIKRIVEGPYNLFAKCASVVIYIFTAGQDKSVWPALSKEVKEERITLATRLVMKLLDCDIEPEVVILTHKQMEKESPGAGGFCRDGGKQIAYREDLVDNFDWLSKTVCHECFHAFQNKAEVGGWKQWYWDELGVTEGRVNMWTYNHSLGRYVSIGENYEHYMIQIIECDARGFEFDCIKEMGLIYSEIDKS